MLMHVYLHCANSFIYSVILTLFRAIIIIGSSRDVFLLIFASFNVTGCFHGSYGQNCLKICRCQKTCDCDPETGECPSENNYAMLNATKRCKAALISMK